MVATLKRVSHVAAMIGMVAWSAIGCGSSTPAKAAPTTRVVPTTSTLVGVDPSSGCRAATTTPLPTLTIKVNGTIRDAVVSYPTGSTKTPMPLIVLLHGMGQTPQLINTISDLPTKAATQHTMVVTPAASGKPSMWQPSATGDDAQFISGILDRLEATSCIDTARVYVVGFSVGAFMGASYACANEDRVTAIATVAVQFPGACKQPIAFLAFHGTADPIVPFAAGAKGAIGGGVGTVANVTKWAQLNKCETTPQSQRAAAKATRLTWPDCAPESETVLYQIDGGGHAWPGSRAKEGADVVAPDDSVDATELMLKFFAAHHR